MSERFMKNFNGDKVFSLEYDKETLKDMVLEKQEENDKLQQRIDKAILYIYTTANNTLYGLERIKDTEYGKRLLEILQGVDK